MRQWNVNPRQMCNKHLVAEHCELHMFVGTIKRCKSIVGFVQTGLVETGTILRRHDRLVEEMKRRGMNHKSPLPEFTFPRMGKVDAKANKQELFRRCAECRKLQQTK